MRGREHSPLAGSLNITLIWCQQRSVYSTWYQQSVLYITCYDGVRCGYIFLGFVLCFRVTGSSSRPSYRDAFTVLIVFVLDRGRDDHGGSAYSLGDAVT